MSRTGSRSVPARKAVPITKVSRDRPIGPGLFTGHGFPGSPLSAFERNSLQIAALTKVEGCV